MRKISARFAIPASLATEPDANQDLGGAGMGQGIGAGMNFGGMDRLMKSSAEEVSRPRVHLYSTLS